MTALSEIARENDALLRGERRECAATLSEVEGDLGFALPADVTWLLTEYGYGLANPVPNLRSGATATLRLRATVELPRHFLLIDDKNDAGVVLLDLRTSAGQVIWLDSHAIHKLPGNTLQPEEFESFTTFADWVTYCIELERG